MELVRSPEDHARRSSLSRVLVRDDGRLDDDGGIEIVPGNFDYLSLVSMVDCFGDY